MLPITVIYMANCSVTLWLYFSTGRTWDFGRSVLFRSLLGQLCCTFFVFLATLKFEPHSSMSQRSISEIVLVAPTSWPYFILFLFFFFLFFLLLNSGWLDTF